MIRIATRHPAGSENGRPPTDLPAKLLEVTTRLAGILRDLGLLGRGPVRPEESPGETTTIWTDEDYLYIEAIVSDDLGASIDVSTCGSRVLVRIERSHDHQRRQPRPIGWASESDGPLRGTIPKPTIRIGQ